MSDEKWKSQQGHPISSSETDNVELKPCPFEWFTRRLNEIRAGSHHKDEGITFYISPMEIERVNEAYKAFNTRANEPETVSVDDLMTSASQRDSANYYYGWNDAIDHLRAQYPNGVKWED